MIRWSGMLAVGLAAGMSLTACTSTPDAAPAVPEPCLGSVQLCDLPLTEVGLLGAHQAAATATSGDWVAPWTNLSLTQLLDRDVRAFHLQLRSGIPYADGVLTDPEAAPPPAPVVELRPALEQARRKLQAASPTGESDVYVCDSWCELGAVRLSTVLRELNAWFVENPRQLVVLDLEDYVPAADVADAFRSSRLDARVISGDFDPTDDVEEILASGQVLVTHRNASAADPAWYRSGLVRRTPPLPVSGSPGACRAQGDAPMLAVEHWVAGRGPELADGVANNEQSVLAARISDCRRESGQLPTLLMLSFPEVGDGARALAQVRDVG